MKSKTTFLLYYLVIIITFCTSGFTQEDSTKTNTSVLKGLKLSLNFYEEFLKIWADCLDGSEIELGGEFVDCAEMLGLEGSKLPWGFDAEIHFGGKFEKLRFPLGYSYMRCKNPGKNKDSYLKTSRHLIFGGLLFYMNDFEKNKMVPYISGNLGYYIYSFKVSYETETELLETLVDGFKEKGFSYYLTAGLTYCIDDNAGFGIGVNFNGKMNDFSFSVVLVSNVK